MKKKEKMFLKTGYGSLRNSQSKNIFSINDQDRQPLPLNNTIYSIVGDQQFRKKYLSLNNSSIQIQKKEQISLQKHNKNQSIDLKKITKRQKTNFNSSPFQRFRFYTSKWENFNKTIIKNLQRRSLMKTSIPQLYAHPNPQRIDLINDNIPQHWIHSLRNNNKRMKSFMRGHNFRSQLAQQMLQTTSGTKFLQESIPKIKIDWGSKTNFRSQPLKLKSKPKNLKQIAKTDKKFELLDNADQVYKINSTLKQFPKKL